VSAKRHIDQKLLERAHELSGLATEQETVDAALREFIQRHLKRSLLSLRGQIEYFEDYDYKAGRRNR
jgi:Arc/MetJ family transcription regulator